MSTIPTSRRGTAAVFIAVLFVSAACGSKTEVTDVGSAPGSIAVRAPFHPSADTAERQAQQLKLRRSMPVSPDAVERQALQEQQEQAAKDPAVRRYRLDPRVR